MAKNLFAKAKEKSGSAPAKTSKSRPEVVVADAMFFQQVNQLAELKKQMDALKADYEMVYGEVKNVAIDKFNEKYENDKKFTDTFMIIAEDGDKSASFMFAPTDNYLKIDADRAQFLTQKFGDVVDENTKYIFNKELLEDEKIGEEISKLIESSKVLTAKQKEELVTAEVNHKVKKGVIKEFRSNDNMRKFPIAELTGDFQPIFQIKSVKSAE